MLWFFEFINDPDVIFVFAENISDACNFVASRYSIPQDKINIVKHENRIYHVELDYLVYDVYVHEVKAGIA